MTENTAGRGSRRTTRAKGYAPWAPRAKNRELVGQVQAILAEYADHLPLTVRQVFYMLVGRVGYEKTEVGYDKLGEMLTRARRARMIPFESFRDDGIVIYESASFVGVDDFWGEVGGQAERYRRDRQEGQRYRVELWCEAGGMAPQLSRVAGEFSVPVIPTGGFQSVSMVRLIVDRALRSDRPTVLLHVGDFDPSGESIFESLLADALAFLEEDRTRPEQRLLPRRVALTREQVVEFDLPTAPAKGSDSRSARWRGGGTCQLEALPPDALAAIVRAEVVSWFDAGVLRGVLDREVGDRVVLADALRSFDS